MHPHVHCHNIYDSPDMEATCVHWWIKKLCIIKYYSVLKRNLVICDMSEPEGHYVMWNVREGEIVYNLKKKKKKVFIKTEIIGTKNRLMIARGEGGQKVQTSSYKVNVMEL